MRLTLDQEEWDVLAETVQGGLNLMQLAVASGARPGVNLTCPYCGGRGEKSVPLDFGGNIMVACNKCRGRGHFPDLSRKAAVLTRLLRRLSKATDSPPPPRLPTDPGQ